MFLLRFHSPFPPGQFPYTQHEGIHRVFKGDCDLFEQAKRVSSFRSANGLPRPSLEEAVADIDIYTCARLGNDDKWCRDADATYNELVIANRPRKCGACGAKVK